MVPLKSHSLQEDKLGSRSMGSPAPYFLVFRPGNFRFAGHSGTSEPERLDSVACPTAASAGS
jgi:hypothetical protein